MYESCCISHVVISFYIYLKINVPGPKEVGGVLSECWQQVGLNWRVQESNPLQLIDDADEVWLSWISIPEVITE